MTKITKIPPLKCPKCDSIKVTMNSAWSVACEDWGVRFTKMGNILEEPFDRTKGFFPANPLRDTEDPGDR